jgi:hypothetical protein
MAHRGVIFEGGSNAGVHYGHTYNLFMQSLCLIYKFLRKLSRVEGYFG